MKYRLIIKEQAKSEIEDVVIYYNEQREDLGFEFWDAVEIALQDIGANPLGYQIKYDVYRTKLIKPFPYLLIFELIGKDIVVYQCFGGKEDPSKKYKNS
jgi:hypothetical protein